MSRGILRSTGAILAGLVTITVLSTATDTVLEQTGVFPSVADQLENGFDVWWMVLLATVYRGLFGVVAGYVVAALAPRHPVGHAVTLGVIGIVLTIAGSIPLWGITPVWYTVALVVLCVPTAYAGGVLRGHRSTRRHIQPA